MENIVVIAHTNDNKINHLRGNPTNKRSLREQKFAKTATANPNVANQNTKQHPNKTKEENKVKTKLRRKNLPPRKRALT